VRTVDDGRTTTTVDPANGLEVDPSTGLVDGQVVEVTLPGSPGPDTIVLQCASEASEAADPTPWCDFNTVVEPTSGDADFRVTVVRNIDTRFGIVDCAEAEGRCVIGARSGGEDLTAPLSFGGDLEPVSPPVITVEPTTVESGEAVTVTGAGYRAGSEVTVSQCRANGDQGDTDGCEFARAVTVVADADGRFVERMLVHEEIFGNLDGWQSCDPCLLYAAAIRHVPATAPVDVGPSAAPARPTVTIDPPGPYQTDQRVRLDGAGFQADSTRMSIGWCGFTSDDPTTEVRGAEPGGATCVYPSTTLAVQTAADGSFTLDDFPMPPADFRPGGASCADPSVRCGLAWYPNEGSLPIFVTPFEMTVP
jgi:hypothetical protein